MDHGAGTVDIAAYLMMFTREPIGYRRDAVCCPDGGSKVDSESSMIPVGPPSGYPRLLQCSLVHPVLVILQ